MSFQRSTSNDTSGRFIDRSKDPAVLLAAQSETLPCSGYFQSSRIKSTQAIIILCSGADINNPAVLDSGGLLDASDPDLKWRSWSDAKPSENEKVVEDQLTACHKEYCRLFQAHGGQQRVVKGSPKAPVPCRSCADPTPEHMKTVVTHMRRLTSERVVFHYINHRAPSSVDLRIDGMLSLYCQDSAEHRSLKMRDVHDEIASPVTYIFDCPHAGRLIGSLNDILSPDDDVVALGTCGGEEVLPWDRYGLPVDLFTACLMSPVRAALNFYRIRGAVVLSEPLLDTLQAVVGKPQDRSSPLGELASIYTAITDAIAWSSFEPHIFKRLFREDGALAELFRNYLLAQRILVAFDLHAKSRPPLPLTHLHHLWDVWDTVLELFLVRLSRGPAPTASPVVKSQTFFEEQMAAFWVWLRFHPELSGHGMGSTSGLQLLPQAEAPVELPIVLHGLLHPSSRLEALCLLARFVDLGVGAVHFVLLVGARPYLTKLLAHDDTEATPEVSPLCLLVWTKMLTFDAEGKEGILNKDNFRSFFNLAKASLASHQRAFASLCLAIACHNRPLVKAAVWKLGAFDLVAALLTKSKRPLLLWMTALFCGELCRGCPEAAQDALNSEVAEVLLQTLSHSAQAVRASAVYAIGCILKAVDGPVPNNVQAGGLDAAVPLFRRFLGLSTSGSDTAEPFFSDGPPAKQGDNLVWFSSSLIWCFSSMSHLDSSGSRQNGAAGTAGSLNPIVPDCAILNETSMLVRHELLCALAPWVSDLSASHAACFSYFDSLPSPPWDVPTVVVPPNSPRSRVLRSIPSCPSLSKLPAGSVPDEVPPSRPFTSESIMYDWTINCLQQPNAVSHAVHHDLVAERSRNTSDGVSTTESAPSMRTFSDVPDSNRWESEASKGDAL